MQGRRFLQAVALLLATSALQVWGVDPSRPCNVSAIHGYNDGTGKTLINANTALDCLNAITLPYDLAMEEVTALAAYYEEFYVFHDIAANPLASLHAEELDMPGMRIYSTKGDIQGRMKALAASFPKARRVPLAKLLFGINKIMLSVHDGSHTSTSLPGAFGGVLGDGSWSASFCLMDLDPVHGPNVVSMQVSSVNGKVVFSDGRNRRTLVTIGGKKPMTWLREMADGPFSTAQFKSLGVRLNNLLDHLNSRVWDLTQDIPDLPAVAKASWVVRYSDGSNSSWVPHVGLKTSLYSSLNVAQLSAMASQPAQPYLALQAALNRSGYTPPPAAARHRRSRELGTEALGVGAGVPGNIITAGGQAVGNYFVTTDSKGKKVAVWKLNTFEMTADEYARHWRRLVEWAKGNGTDRLIYDITGNGGGELHVGSWAVAALYPNLLDPSNTYPWLNSNDRRVGPAAKYLIDNNLLWDGIIGALDHITDSATWMDARVAALNAEGSDELASILEATERIVDAINILIANNTHSQGCSRGTLSCGRLWNENLPLLLEQLQSMSRTNITAAGLNSTLSYLESFIAIFVPFSEEYPTTLDGKNVSSIYSAPTQHLRGGVVGGYTQRYFVTTLQNFPSPPVPASPFKQILASTDGSCGSTCDTFARTAWLYSFNNPSAPSFKFVGFGGTGYRDDMTGTSFPGGSATRVDMLSQAWAFYGIAYVSALWSGDKDVISTVQRIGSKLPAIPPYTGNLGVPPFTQSQVYQTTLGPYALPQEYYLIPPDYYTRQWFSDYSAPSASNNFQGGSDLPALYSLTAKYFK